MKTADNLRDAELFCFLVAQKPLLKLRIELKVLADNITSDVSLCLRYIIFPYSPIINYVMVIALKIFRN